jgi:hypothetical protein
MASETPRDLSDILASDPDIIVRGVREAVHRHKQLGLPMAVWRDGAVVWIAPEDLERQMDEEP